MRVNSCIPLLLVMLMAVLPSQRAMSQSESNDANQSSTASELQSPGWPYCGRVKEFPAEKWSAPVATTAWDSNLLNQLTAKFHSLDSAAMMVIHQGRPILALGKNDERYDMASLRKSVASALIGTQIVRPELSLDTTIGETRLDESELPLSATEKTVTLAQLMGSRSGIYRSAHYEMGSWKRAKRAVADYALETHGKPQLPPGSYWLYNNWDFNLAVALMEARLGEKAGPLFANTIAAPTQMQDFRAQDVTYVGNDSYAERRMGNVSDIPAYMFTMSTRDLARLGLLYLNCGQWQDHQIVPRDWVLRSTRGQDIADGAPSENSFHHQFGDYGLMWWVDRPGNRTWTGLKTREPVYFGQGYRGHYLWVAPYLDLVVVHQVATTGGVGTWGQLKRRVFGSDEISDDDFIDMLDMILRAHPDRATAFEPVQASQ